MIITKEVEITISGINKKIYGDLGYDVSQKKVLIKIEDVAKHSKCIIYATCDVCNTEKTTKYVLYNNNIKNCGYYTCSQKCARTKNIITNMERYGVENPMYNKEICDKVKSTNLERYGVEHALQNDSFKNKVKSTNLERYGVECSLYNDDVRNKTKKTILERYGVEHVFQNSKIKEKIALSINNIPDFYKKRNIVKQKTIEAKKETIDWKKWMDYKKLSAYYFDRIRNEVLENWNGFDYYDGEYIKPYFSLIRTDVKYPTIDHIISTRMGFELGIDPKELNTLKNLVVTKKSINSSKGKKILDISKLDMFELNPDYVPDISILNIGYDWCIYFKDGTNIYIKNMKKYCRENNYSYDDFIKGRKYSGNIINVTKIKKP